MRGALWASVLWLGMIETYTPPAQTLEGLARIVAIAAALGTLSVLIYRLGKWRQELQHTKENVESELRQYRSESATHFERIERRLESIEQVVACPRGAE